MPGRVGEGDWRMGVQTNIERRLLTLLLKLPRPIQAALLKASSEPPVRKELDWDLRLLMMSSSVKPELNSLPPKQARKHYRSVYDLLDYQGEMVAHVRDIKLSDEGCWVRIYNPEQLSADETALPAVMFMHGGGFTIGDVPTYDGVCRMLANRLRAVIVSVDYRLGPEHPYPAGVNDCVMTWDWLNENAESLGIDPKRIGIMGDSAGGNLSAVVSVQAQLQNKPLPKAQCLVYPTTDLSHQTDSLNRYGKSLGLTEDLIRYFDENYLPTEENLKDSTLSPLFAASLKGQPPAVVVVCRDPLHDEGVQYASRLKEAGSNVTLLNYPHLMHGFFGMGGVIKAADDALAEICTEFAAMLS